jgi:hypothetical protein
MNSHLCLSLRQRANLGAVLALSCSLVWPCDSHAQNTPANVPATSALDPNTAPWLRPNPALAQPLTAAVEAVQPGAATKLQLWSRPGEMRLRSEVKPPNASFDWLARGAETLVVDTQRQRVSRSSFNGASQWFRLSSFGPLSVLAQVLAPTPEEVSRNYSARAPSEAVAAGETGVELVANQNGRLWVREEVRVGGSGGERYYAARGRWVWNRPSRIRLTLRGRELTKRVDMDARGRVLRAFELEWKDGRPASITQRDFNGREVVRWNLSWGEAPPNEAFALPPAAWLRENEEPTGTSGGEAELWHERGVLAARREDIGAAITAWQRAAQASPTSTAPHFALFDAALQTRNAPLAQASVSRLEELLPQGQAITLGLRARLQAATRDREGLRSTLEALEAQPLSDDVRWQTANAWASSGEVPRALQVIAPLLSEATPPALAALGARAYSDWLLSLPEDQRSVALQGIAGDAWPRRLARTISSREEIAEAQLPPHGLAAWALRHEAQGQWEKARETWGRVEREGSEELWLEAQLHLLAVHAQRDDLSSSLASYRQLASRAQTQSASQSAQNALIGAWDKAQKRSKLGGALQSAALSPAATDEDSRLWLAFQESFADPADAATLVRQAATRWGNRRDAVGAWWQSRLADALAGLASDATNAPGTGPGAAVSNRDRLFAEAVRAVDAAIAADADEPFYRAQKAFILTRRAARPVAVADANSRVSEREAASKAIAAMRVVSPVPSAPLQAVDASISSGVAKLGLAEGKPEEAIADLRAAIEGDVSSPLWDANDHRAMFAARLSLAAARRRARDLPGAMQEYERLLNASRTSAAQSGVALNMLNVWVDSRDATGPARLSTRLVRGWWPFSETQATLSEWFSALASRPELLASVRQELVDTPGPEALLAGAYLDFGALQSIRRRAKAPNAPAEIQQALAATEENWKATRAAIEPLAQANDAILGAQVLALLAQEAASRGEASGTTPADVAARQAASSFFIQATQREPGDLNLRQAAVRALAGGSTPPSAEATARVAALRRATLAGGRSSVNLRWAAWMARRAGEFEVAASLAREAMNVAAVDPGSPASLWSTAAFEHALALSNGANAPAAVEVWKRLGGLDAPRWQRTAALLAQAQAAQRAGNDAEAATVGVALRTLAPTALELQDAQAFLRELE